MIYEVSNLENNYDSIDSHSTIIEPMSFLTDRERIGFLWELQCQKSLSKFNINFTGNPSNPIEWKKDIAKGFDIGIKINGRKTVAVECKYLNHNVYLSYVHRDWYPRFEDKAVYEPFKIFVVNNKLNVPSHVMKQIEDRGYMVKELDEFIEFILNIQQQFSSSASKYSTYFLLPSSFPKSVLRDYVPFLAKQEGVDVCEYKDAI